MAIVVTVLVVVVAMVVVHQVVVSRVMDKRRRRWGTGEGYMLGGRSSSSIGESSQLVRQASAITTNGAQLA